MVNIVGIPWSSIDRASDNLREEYFNRKVPTHIEEIPLVFRMTQREGTSGNLTPAFHRVASCVSATGNVKCSQIHVIFVYENCYEKPTKFQRSNADATMMSWIFCPPQRPVCLRHFTRFRHFFLEEGLFYLREIRCMDSRRMIQCSCRKYIWCASWRD